MILAVLAISVAASQSTCMATCIEKLTKVQSYLPKDRINEKCLRMCGLGGLQFSKDKIKGLKKTYELVKNQIYKKRSSKVLGNSCMTACVAKLTKVQSNLPKNRIKEKCLRMCGLGAVNLGTYTYFTMNH